MSETADGLRVLVVDDEALIRWSITEKLIAHGYTVREAHGAASVLSVLSNQTDQPDVILLDYRLPDSTDLGLLRKVREAAPEAAVIMMTAFGTPEMLTEAMDLGVYRVLSKPFDLGQLTALVREAYLSRRSE